MFRFLTHFFTLAVLFGNMVFAQSLKGKVLQKNFAGPISKQTIFYNIYLPEGYDTSTVKYPVIYHLHGINGNQGGNQNTTVPASFEQAKQAGLIGPVIVVFPNGYVNSMWADSKDSLKPAETNIVPELIAHVDSAYRTLTERRYRVISGFSMGGFGAAKFIAKFPNLFSICIIYDGALHTWQSLQSAHPDIVSEIFNNDETYFNQYSPWTFANQNVATLRDSVKIRYVVGALTNYSRSYRDYMMGLKIPFEYIETTCAHNLGCLIDTEGGNSAAFIAKNFFQTTRVGTKVTVPSEGFILEQNYPNPFNPTTTIRFSIPKREYVKIKVFDVLGCEVANLANGELNAGEYSVQFDGAKLSSGIYYYKITAGNFSETRKAIFIR